jgi:hypothetical protein
MRNLDSVRLKKKVCIVFTSVAAIAALKRDGEVIDSIRVDMDAVLPDVLRRAYELRDAYRQNEASDV